MEEKAVRISQATYNKVREIAKKESRTIKAIVDLAVDKYAKKT